MSNEIRLADLVVDCPDAIKLSQFYHELLDWKLRNCSAIPQLSVKTA